MGVGWMRCGGGGWEVGSSGWYCVQLHQDERKPDCARRSEIHLPRFSSSSWSYHSHVWRERRYKVRRGSVLCDMI
jgi:hypothetical protein